MKLIAAVSENWGIGLEGKLLYSIPADMAYFKDMTMGSTVVMGRRTLESLPGKKPLPGRENYVLSSRGDYEAEGFTTLRNEDEVIALCKRPGSGEVFVIGGAQVYSLMLPYCDEAYITKIEDLREADKFFPNLDELPGWELAEASEVMEHEGLRFTFNTYKRVSPAE